MLFQTFWYQIFENLTKIELWGIFRVKYIFMVENFIIQILKALGLEYLILQNSTELNFDQIFKYLVPNCLKDHYLFKKYI